MTTPSRTCKLVDQGQTEGGHFRYEIKFVVQNGFVFACPFSFFANVLLKMHFK